MKKKLLIIVFLLTSGLAYSQALLVENFEFSGNLVGNGWTQIATTITNPIATTTGLTYAGYASSNIGNAAYISANGQDVNKSFTSVNSGNLYLSGLLNVSAAPSSAGYFLSFGYFSTNLVYNVKVFIQSVSEGYNLGLSNNSSSGTYNTTKLSLSTTYLFVLKHNFASDESKLWIFNSGVPATEIEAGTAFVSITGDQAPASLSEVCLRQFNTSHRIIIDGIRIATTWDNAPLPVELTSFTAKYLSSGVVLNWQTATEINNNKFEVERQINDGNWEVVGEVLGHGNSNTVIDYTYTDSKTSTKGKYNYRLKQIDNDGTFKYTQVVNVTVGNLDSYELAQNYPNPFNPSTNINFTMPKAGNVKIVLFNALGQEVATLFNGNKDAGFHTVQFNANGLPSGIYFYQMTSEGFNQVKKMILAK